MVAVLITCDSSLSHRSGQGAIRAGVERRIAGRTPVGIWSVMARSEATKPSSWMAAARFAQLVMTMV
ncbi:MAG: hypothetical protein B9S26_01680 [Opitutia bacterium Tous-C4FEB]|nr:MAG: hypothetical protein B9S26_01680 [Opitutae bacterium Tous-C4FEB]